MRNAAILAVFVSILAYADSSSTAKRDAAIKAVDACLQRDETSSRECRKLNKNVQTLVDVYEQGDKSILPTLFKFTYLTKFYDDALLADPDGFLTAMSQLAEKDQKAVAAGVAGGMFGLPAKERFDAITTRLSQVTGSEPLIATAQLCLRMARRINASFLLSYFPPQTFAGRAADFQIRWFSADMYALGESPLWPNPAGILTTYRLTYLPAFAGPTVISLTLSSNGAARIAIKTLGEDRDVVKVDRTLPASQEQVRRFLALLDQAHFWSTPTELPSRGKDGAEWILEGVQDGKYRVVARWSPNIERQSDEEIEFAEAGQFLFELVGQGQAH